MLALTTPNHLKFKLISRKSNCSVFRNTAVLLELYVACVLVWNECVQGNVLVRDGFLEWIRVVMSICMVKSFGWSGMRHFLMYFFFLQFINKTRRVIW